MTNDKSIRFLVNFYKVGNYPSINTLSFRLAILSCAVWQTQCISRNKSSGTGAGCQYRVPLLQAEGLQ